MGRNDLDNREVFLSVLSEFPDFTEKPNQPKDLFIDLSYKKDIELSILLAYDDYERNNNMPLFLLVDSTINYPHIMTKEYEYESVSYRCICLYQDNYFIFSNMSLTEKVAFCLEQFSKLMNLSSKQIEIEYQKEFLFHWNQNVESKKIYQALIEDTNQAKDLDVYRNSKSNNYLRISDNKLISNDSKRWNKTEKIAVFVPIQDSTGILPHSDGQAWTNNVLNLILRNHQVDRISSQAYSFLKVLIVKKQIIIVFSMQMEDVKVHFACELKFGTSKKGLLLDKIESDLIRVEHMRIRRNDFNYLCEAIGNQNNLTSKNIGIVGMGSLGSYVANELVNAGALNITIYDSDYFEPVNLLRHRLSYFDIGNSKVKGIHTQLQSKHPQVIVNYYEVNLNNKNILELVLNNNINYLIITVGSTDIQAELEKSLNKLNHKIVVVYIWLEYDGINSKVLVTNNSDLSIFYDYVNKEPRHENMAKNMIFDGCGGTRVKYGNRTLLTASNALLHAFENMDTVPIPFIISANIVEGLNVTVIEKKVEGREQNDGCIL